MKTPKIYADNLKNNVVTQEMLGQVIYSYNKRAKNYRDKEREYRGIIYDKYSNEEKNRKMKKEMYVQKEFLLSLVKPVCIHAEKQHKRYICKTEDEYDENITKFIESGTYFDRDISEYVEYTKIEVNTDIKCYYLFYDLGEYTFHKPLIKDNLDGGFIEVVDIEKLKKQHNVDIIEIDNLITEGKEISDLLSVQFCTKVVEELKDGTAKLNID